MSEPTPVTTVHTLIGRAWGIIANVTWAEQSDEWRDAVQRWQEAYRAYLRGELEPTP